MTAPIYSVVIYTSATDVEPGIPMTDPDLAVRVYDTVAKVSCHPIALYRHDGPKATCLARRDAPQTVAASQAAGFLT